MRALAVAAASPATIASFANLTAKAVAAIPAAKNAAPANLPNFVILSPKVSTSLVEEFKPFVRLLTSAKMESLSVRLPAIS